MLITALGIALALTVGVLAGSASLPDHHFQEGGAITYLSTLLLAIAAGHSATAFFLAKRQPRATAYFWLLSALGFGFFALDELMQFHERLGSRTQSGDPSGPSVFRNWNDVIVISHGVVALGVCAVFLGEILRVPGFAPLCVAGALFYVVHTAVDSLTLAQSYKSVIIEEAAKLCASASFALAYFAAAVGFASQPPDES